MKIDANGLYGACGMYSCIYYNLYVACSTTAQGKSCNAAAALFFESFLNNNVPFGSMNELVTFIHNVITEERFYSDADILDENITFEECFYKLMASTGWGWIPSEEEMEIIWNMITQLGQEDINRLFYKNNLFHFVDNSRVKNAILNFLCKLDKPYMDPNVIPEEAKEELEVVYDLMREYVYYQYQIIDRLDKMYYLIRSNSIIQDTDSAIISLDGWYRYILQFCDGVPMTIKNQVCDLDKILDGKSDYARPSPEKVLDYDFLNDEIIEVDRFTDPMVIIPQDNLKFSIINLLSHVIGRLVNDYMERYCKNSNSDSNGTCMITLKNEFLFERVLTTDAKKHYATKVKLQEGNIIEEDGEHDLDIKGMEAFVKSSMAEETRTKLKKILYEDILKCEQIDQIKVIKDIAIMEKEIYESIQNGDKKYFKPVKVKSQSAYEDPMRIQGIKAACVYNALHEDGTEALDLTVRNSVDVVKVEITPRNIDLIKDTHPLVYSKAMELFKTKEFSVGIDAVAIPINEPVPEWVKPFIRYAEIINDNVSKFPLESIGLYRGNANNNATNIISF